MAEVQDFVSGIQKLQDFEDNVQAQVKYMSDMNNWVMVHATKYMPRRLSDGSLAIPTTAMATNYDVPRATVHTTLNHIVDANSGGNWNDMSVVILAPFNDVVGKNENPIEVSLLDTYFAPDVKTGLVLPPSAHIVRAGDVPDGKLFDVQKNETVYKIDGFTDSEKQQIIARMGYMARDRYMKLERGDIEDWEVKQALMFAGPTAQKLYDGARDKSAFLRGMFIDEQNAILANTVRDMAVDQTIRDMGYRRITSRSDAGDVAQQVAKTALANKMSGNASNKGHFNSVLAKLEWTYADITSFFKDNLFNQSSDLDKLYNYISSELNKRKPSVQATDFVKDITGVAPLDFHKYFNETFDFWAQNNKLDAKSITEYNKNVSVTIDNWIKKFSNEYMQWRNKLQSMSGYNQFVTRLRGLMAAKNAEMAKHMLNRAMGD